MQQGRYLPYFQFPLLPSHLQKYRLARPRPKRIRSSSSEAPTASAASTALRKLLRTRRTGANFFKSRRVSLLPNASSNPLNTSFAELSAVKAKRVPICTPSALSTRSQHGASPVCNAFTAANQRKCSNCTYSWYRAMVVLLPLQPTGFEAFGNYCINTSAFFLPSRQNATRNMHHHRDATLSCNQPVHFFGLPGRCKYNLHPSSATNLHYLFLSGGYIKEYSHQKHDACSLTYSAMLPATFRDDRTWCRASPAPPHCLQQQQVSSRYTTPYHLELSDILFK